MLFEVSSPSPAPTATVTQTVLVPTSIPTPVVTVPPDSVGWPTLLEGFLGAFLGILVSACIAWLLVKRESKLREIDNARQEADRQEERRITDARIQEDRRFADQRIYEERRAALGAQLVEVLDDLLLQVQWGHGNRSNIMRVTHTLSRWIGQIRLTYANTDDHRSFALWFDRESKTLFSQLTKMLGMLPLRERNLTFERLQMETVAQVVHMQKNVFRWLSAPSPDWQADREVLDDFEGDKAAKHPIFDHFEP